MYTIYKHKIDTDHYEVIYREGKLVEVLAFIIHVDFLPKDIRLEVEACGSAKIDLTLLD
jgi:hypothetical protein